MRHAKGISLLIAAMMIGSLFTACGSSKKSEEAETTNVVTEVTTISKEDYVYQQYGEYLKNSFIDELPYSDIMGLELYQLKDAVSRSDTWNEDTSVWATPEKLAGLAFDYDYAFSNRTLNDKSDNSGSFKENLIDNIIQGGLNYANTKLGWGTYVFVITDGTASQRIREVVQIGVNRDTSTENLKNELSKYKDLYNENGIYSCKGLIGDTSFASIYDYDHGLSSDKPMVFGEMSVFIKDDVIVVDIFSH